MNYKILLVVALALVAITEKAKFLPSERNCSKLDVKIKVVVSKLRAGYKPKQGEKYRTQLRELKNHRYKCKQQKFDVT